MALLAGVLGLVATVGAACSDDADEDAEPTSPTTRSTLSFEEADTALGLNIAATGVNVVATDVGLRAGRDGGVEYCRSEAPAELAPHRSALESAADPEVRRRAGVAIGQLQEAMDLCAAGSDATAVQQAILAYSDSFDLLRERIDALLGTK